MSTDKMDSAAVYGLFEEIKQIHQNAPKQAQVDLSAISGITENLRYISARTDDCVSKFNEALEAINQPVMTHHRHTIDFGSSKIFTGMIVMAMLILIAIFIIYSQRQTISQYRDNDLKYRRVLMIGVAKAEDLTELQNMFDYKRNPQAIKQLRKDVEHFERLVLEQARKSEQSRLNAAKAQQLQKEAEVLKNK